MAAAAGVSRAALERGSFAALVEPQQWSALQLKGPVHAFPRGSVLMFEGAAGDRVMVLLEGRVKVTHTAADGQETVVSIRGPGEIVGELPCLDHRPQLGSVGALEPGRW